MMCLSVHSDRMLLHHFQKCRLCLRRSTVDLICQKQLTVCRTVTVFKTVGLPVKHRKTCNIGRQRIRGKLNTLAAKSQYL